MCVCCAHLSARASAYYSHESSTHKMNGRLYNLAKPHPHSSFFFKAKKKRRRLCGWSGAPNGPNGSSRSVLFFLPFPLTSRANDVCPRTRKQPLEILFAPFAAAACAGVHHKWGEIWNGWRERVPPSPFPTTTMWLIIRVKCK